MLNRLYSLLAQAGLASAINQQRNGISGWWWVIIFLVVVLVVWWLLMRATREKPDLHAHHEDEHGEHEEQHAAQPAEHVAEVAAAVEPEPEAAPAPAPAQPDDLTVLEGVGPKVNGVLQAAGLTTFAQLAAAEVSKLQEILDAAGYNYMDPASWPEQAKLAAEGNWDAFNALTDSLKGGRKGD